MIRIKDQQDLARVEAAGAPELAPNSYLALAASVAAHADHTAIHYIADGARPTEALHWTYAQLLDQVHAAANLFRAHGVGVEDAVSYTLPNVPEIYLTVFGAEACGTVNPINPMLEDEHIAGIMRAAGTKVLVTLGPDVDAAAWAKLARVIPQVPSLRAVFTVSATGRTGDKVEAPPSPASHVDVLDLWTSLADQPSDALAFPAMAGPDYVASCFHTGGTTGSPKLAQRTHRNQLANAWAVGASLGLSPHRVLLCGLPLFHANGVLVTMFLPLLNGHTVVVAGTMGYRDKAIIGHFWRIIAHYRVNFFSAVPTILKALLTVPRDGADISSLEYVVCGAAPLSTQLFNDFESATGIKIVEGYGFTEGVCVNTINPAHGLRKIGSIGPRLPLHTMKVVVLDEQERYVRDAERNEAGVFVAHGINIFRGYKDPNDDRKAWVVIAGERWYNTGDIGVEDADGYFWITGRRKELIIRAGHNIDPKSIEEPLGTHPAVAAVAAVSRPDAHAGELPVAYVELKAGATATEAELLAYAQAHIHERAAVPKHVRIIPQLPLTAVGKVFKPELEKRQVEEVYTEVAASVPGVDGATVSVEKQADGRHVAVITISTAQDRATVEASLVQALAAFTIPYRLQKAKH